MSTAGNVFASLPTVVLSWSLSNFDDLSSCVAHNYHSGCGPVCLSLDDEWMPPCLTCSSLFEEVPECTATWYGS